MGEGEGWVWVCEEDEDVDEEGEWRDCDCDCGFVAMAEEGERKVGGEESVRAGTGTREDEGRGLDVDVVGVDEEGEWRDCGSEEAEVLEPGTVRFDMGVMCEF